MNDSTALARIAQEAPSTTAALERLHEAGASPIVAAKALVDGRRLTLHDAKYALHHSPAWTREARAAEALWDELERAFSDESGGTAERG